MNGNKWLSIVISLVLAAGVSFFLMKKMSAPLPTYIPNEIEQDVPSSSFGDRTAKSAVPKNSGVKDLDVLWQNSLFNDGRSEGENGPEAAAAEQGRVMTNSEFEVVGLASIGKKGETVPVAIIVQTKNSQPQANRSNNMPGRMGGMGMMGRRPVQPQPEPVAEDASNRRVDRNIYRAGDTIGTTGYTVKSIIIEENKVILSRAGSELVLILDESNTSNSVRRDKVRQEALAQQEQFRAKERAEAQQAQERKQNEAETKAMQERVRNFARARGQNLSQEEVQRRVQVMQQFQRQRQMAMQMAQQNQQNQQNQQRQQPQSNTQPQQSNTQQQQPARGTRFAPPGPPQMNRR